MRTLLSILVAIGLLTPPAFAQGGCVIDAYDTVAGLGTEVQLLNCTPNMSFTITVRAPNGTEISKQAKTDGNGDALIALTGTDTRTAGTYDVQTTNASGNFAVLADAPSDAYSGLVASKQQLIPNGEDTVQITATLRDQFSNPLSGRPLALIANRPEDRVSALSAETDAQGMITWTVRTSLAGQVQLAAYDVLSASIVARTTVQAGTSQAVSPFSAQIVGNEVGQGTAFGAVDHFLVEVGQSTAANVNQDLNLTITALDRNNQRVEDYTGTVRVTSTDPQAVLPGNGIIDFIPGQLGRKVIALGLRFRTTGEQTIFVEDGGNSSIRGSTTIDVRGENGQGTGDITVLSPANGTRVNSTTVTVQGRAPTFVNLVVKGGLTEAFGESDEEGVFRIDVQLDPNQQDHTLFVESEAGRYRADKLVIKLDQTPPEIESISFDPEVGEPGEEATITVVSEPKLQTVTAEMNQKTVTLTETESGTYTATFIAPSAGNYDVRVRVKDEPGNEEDILAKWSTEGKGLPSVLAVQADPRPSAVYVEWQPVEDDDVVQYRVYVGENPADFAYGLDTGQRTTSALVNGLNPGKNYFFAVTALGADGEESVSLSPVVQAQPIGMLMTVKPGKESLLLEWSPPQNTPLLNYILEYGTEPGVYTEKRSINGELRAYTLRDLINGVTYEMRLTPVTVTGETLAELATVGRGTPNGEGIGTIVDDPVPFDIDDLKGGAPRDPNIGNVPQTPSSGIPPMALWIVGILTVLGAAFLRHHVRERKRAHAFLQSMNHTYHDQ